jgi:cytochrome oxidase assembly protein ShyY1
MVTLGLGTWQVYRLDWKLDLIQKAQERMHQDPVSLKEMYILKATVLISI